MRNPTELMRAILTDEMAQRMIDWVSPVYGNSYVGLWIFQAMGTVMGEVYTLAEALKQETNPATSTLLLDYWERHYKLEVAEGLTIEQRRANLLAKIQSRGSCNPAKLAAAVSAALGGVEVEITENVSKNKFLVIVRENVESTDPAIAVIERMKPAHLIYEIRVEVKTNPTADIKVATAVTYTEGYSLQATEQSIEAEAYVVGETLVLNSSRASVTDETLVLTGGIARVEGETIIFGGA